MELSDLGKLAISGDKPAGRDIRSEDIYEELVTEINKRGTLNAVGPTNWVNVVNLSQDILQNHSKDILVCSYLCVGLLNTNGLKGLANGVHVYLGLLENYWEGLYPPRIGGRINAIEWWLNTVNEQLRKTSAEVWLAEDLALLKQDFDGLLAFFEQRSMDEPTEIRSVIAKSISLISTESKVSTGQSSGIPNSENVAQSLGAATNNSVAVSSATSSIMNAAEAIHLPDIISASDLDVVLRPIFSALSKISDSLYREQPLSSILFKTNRFVAWVNVTMVPPRESESTTLLPPPDFQLVSTLQQLHQDKNWLELLKTAEARIIEFRFWLDLSYYSYTALTHLNQSAVAQELAYETFSYKNRLKGLEKLCFSDGTPFACDDTQSWLSGLVGQNAASSNMTAVAVGGGSKQNDDFVQDIADAKKLVEDDNLPAAINKLHDKIQSASTKSERFIRVMYFCKFVASIKNKYLAKPYLDELLASCKSNQLDSWDPVLASEAYQIILDFSNYKDLGLDSGYVSEVLNRLMLVDPVSSLRFQP